MKVDAVVVPGSTVPFTPYTLTIQVESPEEDITLRKVSKLDMTVPRLLTKDGHLSSDEGAVLGQAQQRINQAHIDLDRELAKLATANAPKQRVTARRRRQ